MRVSVHSSVQGLKPFHGKSLPLLDKNDKGQGSSTVSVLLETGPSENLMMKARRLQSATMSILNHPITVFHNVVLPNANTNEKNTLAYSDIRF